MIGVAWAMGTGPGGQPAGGGSIFDLIIPFAVIFGIFYVFMIRPQQRQQRRHQETVRSLQRGDEIITSGGVYGTVVNADNDKILVVQIADKVKVKISRSAVSAKLEKGRES